MAIVSAMLALSLVSVGVPSLVEGDHILLSSRSIRLADVMPAARGEARTRILAVLPAGRDRIILSRAAIYALVRRALPGTTIERAHAGSIAFVLRSPSERVKASPLCSALNNSVAAGAAVDAALVTRVTCTNAQPAPLTFDRPSMLPRATVNLPAGTYLGQLSVRPTAIGKGQVTSLVSTVGPVRIVRTVTTLQASHGRRVFVRDSDGQVFAVRRAELIK
ncbi:hypothetical protein DBR17_01215 [Sphingomonas sp. HMWF008]|nr:hypothetical protein DBR17_01215 [Sphingomonas sp. HMWF008]